MKKLLVALGFTMAAMSAQASLVFVAGGTTDPTDSFNDILSLAPPATFSYGTLSADVGDIVTFQNVSLKAEAGFINFFINGEAMFQNKTNDGTLSYMVTASGPLSFSFVDGNSPPQTFSNGSSNIAVLQQSYGGYDGGFLLLLDDSGTGKDYDDHAVYVSAVPVPAALPLMASALGVFGLSRRKSKKAA